MIRGMSSENPALDLVLCIEKIWSEYEMTGEAMMNRGAMKPDINERIPPILAWLDGDA